MTVREYKKMIAEIDPVDDDCIVLMTTKTDLPGVFAFEGVCQGVSGMVELGPTPDYMPEDSRGSSSKELMRVLLIAPHSYHDDEEDMHVNDKPALN